MVNLLATDQGPMLLIDTINEEKALRSLQQDPNRSGSLPPYDGMGRLGPVPNEGEGQELAETISQLASKLGN